MSAFDVVIMAIAKLIDIVERLHTDKPLSDAERAELAFEAAKLAKFGGKP